MQLSDIEKGWTWAQAHLRRQLKLITEGKWTRYQKEWVAVNGELESKKKVLPISRYVRRKPGEYK